MKFLKKQRFDDSLCIYILISPPPSPQPQPIFFPLTPHLHTPHCTVIIKLQNAGEGGGWGGWRRNQLRNILTLVPQ